MIYRFGSFELSTASGELRNGGTRIKLEDKPYRLLIQLLARAGETVSRDELRAVLSPEHASVEIDRGITRAVNKVRAALNDAAVNPRFVETLPKRGYRFIAPVAVDEDHEVARDAIRGPLNAGAKFSKSAWSRALLASVVLALVIAGGIAALIARSMWKPPAPSKTTIAILPFENSSSNGAQAYLADTITDQLIAAMSQMTSRRVVSRASVVRYRRTRLPLSTIARELNVGAVVHGAVASSKVGVRVTVRLIRFPMEQVVWTHIFEREAADGVELVRSIAAELPVALDASE